MRPRTCRPRRAKRATEAAARTLAAVGELPVVVDTCASLRPFSLALALIKAGFNVAAAFALHSKGNDAETEEEFTREHPEIVIVRKQGLGAMAELGIPRACVALGRDATPTRPPQARCTPTRQKNSPVERPLSTCKGYHGALHPEIAGRLACLHANIT